MVACPKPAPTKRRHPDAALDRRESKLVRERSRTERWPEGQCEVVELGWAFQPEGVRCPLPATEVMHLIGGNGKRGRGISALKEHKLHACAQCHDDIDGDLGGRKLIRVGDTPPLWTDPYRRIR